MVELLFFCTCVVGDVVYSDWLGSVDNGLVYSGVGVESNVVVALKWR